MQIYDKCDTTTAILRGIVGGIDAATRVEVACNAFLRWLVAVAGRGDAILILRAMVEHLEREPTA